MWLIIRPYMYPYIPISGTRNIKKAILIARPVMLYAQVLAVMLRPFSMLARLVLTYRKGHMQASIIV